jgi:hypothetical protein
MGVSSFVKWTPSFTKETTGSRRVGRTLTHDALEKAVQGLLDLPQARAAYF